jgi:hypothetical protein
MSVGHDDHTFTIEEVRLGSTPISSVSPMIWGDSMNNLRYAAHSSRLGLGVRLLFCLLAGAGCAQPGQTIDTTSFGPSQDQVAIAGYYRGEALALKEKAAAIAESAVRYEHLFGPQSDWVSGARQLSQYYAVAAQDLERRAEAYEEAARGRQRRR